jgi:probable selenium-dependent hydroxylase accessory protein YqeC
MSTTQFLSPPSNDDFLARCFKRSTPQVVSLVGAGGKTSTLFWLANALYQRGVRVLVTTTTRMHFPDPRIGTQCIVEADFETRLARIAALEKVPGITALFSVVEQHLQKVSGCLPAEIDALKAAGVADVILVEADGANHLALKAPAEHEPCIPASSDVVIALTGGEAIMRPAQPASIHRWPIFAALTGAKEGDMLDAAVFERLLAHPQGMFKNTPSGALRHWLINGHFTGNATENPATLAMLESIKLADSGLDGLWLGDMRSPSPFTHAWVHTNRIQKDLR